MLAQESNNTALSQADLATYWARREHEFAWAAGSMNPAAYPYTVGFEISIPYYDEESGVLHMLMRFPPGRFGCPLHRHFAVTETFVLRGEQVVHRDPDANSWQALLAADPQRREVGHYDHCGGPHELPHLEHGGEHGGLVLLAMRTGAMRTGEGNEQLLFQYFNNDLTLKEPAPHKKLTVSKVVAGTRAQNNQAVPDASEDTLYSLVKTQFGLNTRFGLNTLGHGPT
ncbi:MAG: hypothetical protein GKR94_30955 [Gammaproteobacteria bacterium]|nr:hypothetical protein [Gammaproteobacteria bacterium]